MLSLYDYLENEYKQLSKTTNLELNDLIYEIALCYLH